MAASNLNERFDDLTRQSVNDQVELFLRSFIFELGDDWKSVVTLSETFQKQCTDSGNADGDQLDFVTASDLLQKEGRTRTAAERRDELQDIDLNQDNLISFIEFCILHFKMMILRAFHKRHGSAGSCAYADRLADPEDYGLMLTGVGDELLEELFNFPEGLSPELEAAIAAFMEKKAARENRLKDLEAKAAKGGVRGLAAKNEIEQMHSEDLTAMNREELTLNAARKRASKESGSDALEQARKAAEDEEKRKRQESRNKLAARAAMFQ